MTPDELREAISKLEPSQLDDLIDAQLEPEQRKHVPSSAVPVADRARSIVGLAGQNPGLQSRVETALRTLADDPPNMEGVPTRETGKHWDVFLSYAREDRASAQSLAKALAGSGWTVWWDVRISPGKAFDQAIEEILNQVGCVVVLWSRHSTKSDWVKAEASEAKERGILVPAVLEDGIKAPLGFRYTQNADLLGWSPTSKGHQGFEDLVGAVAELVGRKAEPSAGRAKVTAEVPVPPQEAEVAPEAAAPMPGQPFREKTTKMSFLWVPPGKFWMGSSKKRRKPNFDKDAYDNELPAREVTITDGFWIGEHPVTNAQYAVFMEMTGAAQAPEYWQDSRFNAPDQPLVGVDWDVSRAFARWLTDQAGLGEAIHFDLPTEAEWEYAARGSDGRKYPWGKEPPTAQRADYVNRKPTAVGMHSAGKSPWGVQDMAGGVWEWCLDGWLDSYVTMMTSVVDPYHLPDRGAPRVVRGGSWLGNPGTLRCADRHKRPPEYRDRSLGFRVVCRGSRQHIAF